MIKLYFIPGRSWLPRWLLEELRHPYELISLDLEAGEHKREAYLSVNALGKAPALEIDGKVMTESAAICLHLADRFAHGQLAPELDDPDRPRYLTLMVHASAALDPVLSLHLFKRDMPAEQVGWGSLEGEFAFIEGHLGEGPYLFGERFTAADVMVGGMLIWGMLAGIALPPPLKAYAKRLMQRSALVRLFDEVGGVPQ